MAAVQRAIDSCERSEIASYAFDLAQAFSRFYADSPVLAEANEELRNTRLALCKLTSKVLGKALWLLGIEVPESM
jgi:arginyl-tRNA synthetase